MVVTGLFRLFTAAVLVLTLLEVVNAKPSDGSTARIASRKKAFLLTPFIIIDLRRCSGMLGHKLDEMC
jgi:hypothetical protein